MTDYMCSVIITRNNPTSQWTLLIIRPVTLVKALYWQTEGIEYRALNSRYHPLSCDIGKEWTEGKENTVQYGPGCICSQH